MPALQTTTVGEIVARDYRTAAIFQQYHIDFCCRGGRALEAACAEAGVPMAILLQDLEALPAGTDDGPRCASWDLPVLVDYIVANHHSFVRTSMPQIQAHLAKLCEVHGAASPAIPAIAEHFNRVANELSLHMMKEEQVLFPFIKALAGAAGAGAPPPNPFGSIRNPIAMMEREHQSAGDEMAAIRTLSRNYVPPAEACATWRVTWQELSAFEADLHRHVHLENNLLFPKAVALEARSSIMA